MNDTLFQHDAYSGAWSVPARARATDPSTSHSAARQFTASGKGGNHRDMILAAVRNQPGMTADGIAHATGLNYVQVDRRAKEMQDAGLIARRGTKDGKLQWWPA